MKLKLEIEGAYIGDRDWSIDSSISKILHHVLDEHRSLGDRTV
jgi:hypothetical protein